MSNQIYQADADANKLHYALTSKPKNKQLIISIIAPITNQQRLLIKESYYRLFNKDLFIDLKSELSGNFLSTVKALFYNPIDYDCKSIRKAVKGLGTNEDTLIEILTTRDPNRISQIIKRYSMIFEGRNVIDDIKDDTSGDFRKILLNLLSENRYNNNTVNKEECEQIARNLFDIIQKKKGIDIQMLIALFTQKSQIEFQLISQYYYKLSGETIMQLVEKVYSGDLKKCLKGIIYALLSPSEYFANKINKAISGLGTNDDMLIRIIVSREEIDLYRIKRYYKQIYKKDIIDDIKNDTSGDYSNLLVALLQKTQ